MTRIPWPRPPGLGLRAPEEEEVAGVDGGKGGWLLEGPESEHWTAEQHLVQEALRLCAVHLGQVDRVALHHVLQAAALCRLGQADQPGLQVLGVGLVQVAVLGGEGVGGGPELLGLVLLQAPPKGVRFPDVREVGATVLGVGTREHVYARTTCLRALGELLELGARDHEANATPICFLHDSHPLR